MTDRVAILGTGKMGEALLSGMVRAGRPLDGLVVTTHDDGRADVLRELYTEHPDDETFGCGGTIVRKLAAGATIHVIVMTDGSRAPASAAPADLAAVRRAETQEAARELGLDATHCHFLDSPDGALAAHLGNAVEQLVALFEDWPAEQLFLPYRADGHPDHIATAEAGFRAARLAGRRFEVYEYPVWAWRHWPWAARPTSPSSSA